ncbi:hypothetical protein ACIA98_00685 [Streptomyces sp. NPDC051366]|uniref:hypothetical protein n=1 Tax=Streptomyces sp. NPDC051366 TaxID=3365652 RepID=UPI0037AF4F3E
MSQAGVVLQGLGVEGDAHGVGDLDGRAVREGGVEAVRAALGLAVDGQGVPVPVDQEKDRDTGLQQEYLTWIADRFAGRPAPDNC